MNNIIRRLQEQIREATYDKLELVLNHIENVQRNCYKLGMKLIKAGEVEMGRILISNGQIHDNSKLRGIEFEHLFPDSLILKDVVSHHNTTNPHHPEYWGGIHNMPKVYIAEMVCDCCGRASEFGSDVREWFCKNATEKYKFNMEDEIGRQINYYLDLLLSAPFKKI